MKEEESVDPTVFGAVVRGEQLYQCACETGWRDLALQCHSAV